MPFEPVPDPGPFLEHVGPVLADGDVIALRIAPHHLNRSGAAQGGLLATLVDFALGRAIHATAESRAVTVSLTTDYLARPRRASSSRRAPRSSGSAARSRSRTAR